MLKVANDDCAPDGADLAATAEARRPPLAVESPIMRTAMGRAERRARRRSGEVRPVTPQTLLILGPTASGKTAVALRLAEDMGAEIIGADSMQIYADLPILSAAPTAEEQARVPHHLVGTVDAAKSFSVGAWLAAATEAMADIHRRGKRVIVVGGTGLYFMALTRGLAQTPDVPREESAALSEEALRNALKGLDPAAEGRILPGDRQRLIRAHAVAIHTGRPLTDWQSETTPALAPGSWRGLVLTRGRTSLYERCDARFRAMVEAGAVQEVEALAARGLKSRLPALGAVGYSELLAHAQGELSLEDAIEQAQRRTRRYVKRQVTWLRHQVPDWPRVRV